MELRIILAIGAMFILAFGVVLFVVLYQRRMMAHSLEVQRLYEERRQALREAAIVAEEGERQRIAQELHDDVGATLSTTRMFLYPSGGTYDPEAMKQARGLLDDAIQKVRDLSHQLQPALLQRLGLERALESLAMTLHQASGMPVGFSARQALPPLSPQTALALYRIVQEVVTNIFKHSGASTIAIQTGGGTATWQVTVLHDGTGLTQESFAERLSQPGAIGLKNIVNRLELIGGSIQLTKTGQECRTTLIGIPMQAG